MTTLQTWLLPLPDIDRLFYRRIMNQCLHFDADKAVEIFRKEGLPVDSEPADLTLDTNPKMHIRVAFVRGKAGESIEIFQEK